MKDGSHDPSGTGTAQGLLGMSVDTSRWIELHRAGSRADLRSVIVRELVELVPLNSLAILLETDEGGREFVECVCGRECPLLEGSKVLARAWRPSPYVCLPLLHENDTFGRVLISGQFDEELTARLFALVQHYSVALTNLMLREQSYRSVEDLRSSLQAFEDGVVLFQDPDAESAAARFLQLCMTVLGVTAGAIFLLEEINNVDSPLILDQSLGLPEEVLLDLRVAERGSAWWPKSLVTGDITVLRRDQGTGQFPVLDSSLLPQVMMNVIGTPMGYDGVRVGVIVLLNAEDSTCFEGKLASARRLFELGAAVFHRLQLEREALRSRHISAQLEIAAVLQARFVPEHPPDAENLDVAWRSEMSACVGGDYLDFIDGELGGYFATISDVAGHGIDSALLMSSFRSVYRSKVLWFSPAALLAHLNDVVRDDVGDTGMFLTSATLKIREDNRGFSFASAGHNPLFLYRGRLDGVELVESTGPPLGLFPGVKYGVQDVLVEPGDVLLMYTDGVVEACAPTVVGEELGEMFGEDRLQDLLCRSAGKSAEVIVDSIFSAMHEFTRGRQDDDVSVLVLKFA